VTDITIYDIAKEAGVSIATVSRVLTKKTCVSDEKRKIVEKIIKKHSYKPNAAARSLSSGTRIIGLMVADIRNLYYATLAIECEKAAGEQGYTVIICNMLNDPVYEDDLLEKLYGQRAEAIIQIGRQTDLVISDPSYVKHVKHVNRVIPFITTGRLEGVDFFSVSTDHTKSMKLVMDYLNSLGHKEIALVGGYKAWRTTYEKWVEYVRLLKLYKLKHRKEFFQEGECTDTAAYACMERILKAKTLPSAVIAINDECALGIILAAQDHGLSVPGDLSVISFDNTYLARLIRPLLTTVDCNFPLLGKTLIDVAIQAAQRKNPLRETLLEPILVVRDSCSRPGKLLPC